MKIKWEPQPKQELVLKRKEDEILYGGARGGGKTDAGMVFPMYHIQHPKYRALVIRKNFTDLSDWIDRATDMYFGAGGKKANDYFEFPSGARIRFGHLADKDAYQKYQGHEYQNMIFEEITHISRESDYEKLRASCRSTVPEIRPQIFATTNPDGPGHEWVKDRWSIPDLPDMNEIYITTDEQSGLSRVFVPSTLDDNPILMNADPNYVKVIESIKDPEMMRAWRHGSWEGFGVEGAYYANHIRKAMDDNRVRTGLYDPTQPVYTWCDLGKGENYAIGFFQKNGINWAVIDYEELKDDEGLAEGIKLIKNKPYIYAEHYAPHDIAVKDFSATRTRKEIAYDMGVDFNIVNRSSVHEGIDVVKFRFPSLHFEDTPNVQLLLKRLKRYHKEWDDSRGIWKVNPAHDENSHGADMMRYWGVTDVRDYNQAMAIKVSQNRDNKKSFR
jgi:hypothetical protein